MPPLREEVEACARLLSAALPADVGSISSELVGLGRGAQFLEAALWILGTGAHWHRASQAPSDQHRGKMGRGINLRLRKCGQSFSVAATGFMRL